MRMGEGLAFGNIMARFMVDRNNIMHNLLC